MDLITFLASTPLGFLSQTMLSILVAVLAALLFWLASHFCKCWLMPKLCAMAERLHLRSLQILFRGFTKPFPVLILFWGLCTVLPMLPLPSFYPQISAFCHTLSRIAPIVCAGWGLWNSTDLCDNVLNSLSAHLDLKANATLRSVLVKTYRVLVGAFVIVAVLDILGYPVTGLITGLGLVGLTVSLAAQDTASNLFSGLMLLLERPFSIGDWITVGDVDGEVEDLTFRSTKVRALDNSLYVLPNTTVTKAVVNNGSTRTKRLYRFNLNLTFDSSRAQLESMMSRLTQQLKADPVIDPDSVVVRVTGFHQSGISILVNAYILRKSLDEFLEIQNRLNLDILDLVREENLRFAMTESRIYLESQGSDCKNV